MRQEDCSVGGRLLHGAAPFAAQDAGAVGLRGHGRRVSLADIGRSMQSGALVKHCIKRVYRFLSNYRVEAPAACGALLALAAKAAHRRLVVAVDWVDVGPYKVLRAAVPLRGRNVPVLFAAYCKWQLFRSQIGRSMQHRLRFSLRALLQPFSHMLAQTIGENWG